MKSKQKQGYNFSILGVVLCYLLISLSNIFLLPNLSVLGIGNSRFEKQKNLVPVGKTSELSRQFKCILEERKKAPVLAQVSLLVSVCFVMGLFMPLLRYSRKLFSSPNFTRQIPIYLSIQVFRI